MKSQVKVTIGLLFSVVSILIIIRFIDFSIVLHNLRKLTFHTVSTVILLFVLNMMLRAWRWNRIININSPHLYPQVFKAIVYGYMLNQLLPAKIGELARAEYLVRKQIQSRSFLLGSIATERIFDVSVIGLFLCISVIFSQTILHSVHSNLIPAVLMLIGFASFILLFYNLTALQKVTKYLPAKIGQKVNIILENTNRSIQIIKSPVKSLVLFSQTLLIWSITCFCFFLICSNLEIRIPFYAYLFIVSAGTFGMIIPSTSANVGVYHAVAMGALMMFMVTKEKALSFAIITHAFDFTVNTGLGLLLVVRPRKILHRRLFKWTGSKQ